MWNYVFCNKISEENKKLKEKIEFLDNLLLNADLAYKIDDDIYYLTF